MRRALLALSLGVLVVGSGCKRKELEAQLAEVQDKLAKTEAELGKEKQSNEKLRAENQTYQERIGELEGELVALNKQIEDLAAKAGTTAQELAELRAEKAKREKAASAAPTPFGQPDGESIDYEKAAAALDLPQDFGKYLK